MLVSANIKDKHFGAKQLFNDLRLSLNRDEKIGFIGRNGTGKSTLFNLLNGSDKDYDGDIRFAKDVIVISTRQEHLGVGNISCIEYILNELPDYKRLKHIIDTYPNSMQNNPKKMNAYSDALEQFSSLGYYNIESSVFQQLATYQISENMAKAKLNELSGGQKRFIELVKIAHSKADLALIDEPTNHMDFLAKQSFIKWLQDAHNITVLVITHDRDVLREVDKIIEIKDDKIFEFKGNYDAYLKQNRVATFNQIGDFETAQRTLSNLRRQIISARSKKLAAPPDTAKKFRIMEDRLQRQYNILQASYEKPSFWIDQENVAQMPNKVSERYHKYKAKNIIVGKVKSEPKVAVLPIVEINNLSLGYRHPIFTDVNFSIKESGRIRLHGRNGAGKTTLVNYILSKADLKEETAKLYQGKIEIRPKLKIGVYEQELSEKYFNLPLDQAIERLYLDKNLSISHQRINQLMSDYLFDPIIDAKTSLIKLSGGQKAKFQLINMLANDPQLLILDEPTNHLDLPSIVNLPKF
jgi:ATPase subunit of ABC transporter with duplicated ATPase domains